MPLQYQRLIIIFLSFLLISAALILILINSKNNIIFFYTPSELIKSDLKINQKVRIGGFVKKNSVRTIAADESFITFIITDNKSDITVEFKGILPNLFREEQGAVVEGILLKNSILNAERVFAKHDENYMPAAIKKQLETAEYWKNKY